MFSSKSCIYRREIKVSKISTSNQVLTHATRAAAMRAAATQLNHLYSKWIQCSELHLPSVISGRLLYCVCMTWIRYIYQYTCMFRLYHGVELRRDTITKISCVPVPAIESLYPLSDS